MECYHNQSHAGSSTDTHYKEGPGMIRSYMSGPRTHLKVTIDSCGKIYSKGKKETSIFVLCISKTSKASHSDILSDNSDIGLLLIHSSRKDFNSYTKSGRTVI